MFGFFKKREPPEPLPDVLQTRAGPITLRFGQTPSNWANYVMGLVEDRLAEGGLAALEKTAFEIDASGSVGMVSDVSSPYRSSSNDVRATCHITECDGWTGFKAQAVGMNFDPFGMHMIVQSLGHSIALRFKENLGLN